MATFPIGASDLLSSERGIFCIASLIAATVLVALGKLDAPAWIDFMKYLVGVLVASKTATAVMRTYKYPPTPSSPAPTIPDARLVKDQTPDAP